MARFLAFKGKNNRQEVINIDELISYTIKYFDDSNSYCGMIIFKFTNNTEFAIKCDTNEEMIDIISKLEKYSINA